MGCKSTHFLVSYCLRLILTLAAVRQCGSRHTVDKMNGTHWPTEAFPEHISKTFQETSSSLKYCIQLLHREFQ